MFSMKTVSKQMIHSPLLFMSNLVKTLRIWCFVLLLNHRWFNFCSAEVPESLCFIVLQHCWMEYLI